MAKRFGVVGGEIVADPKGSFTFKEALQVAASFRNAQSTEKQLQFISELMDSLLKDLAALRSDIKSTLSDYQKVTK